MILLSKERCIALIELIERSLLDTIRRDLTIDNLDWLSGVCIAYQEMKAEVDKDENH